MSRFTALSITGFILGAILVSQSIPYIHEEMSFLGAPVRHVKVMWWHPTGMQPSDFPNPLDFPDRGIISPRVERVAIHEELKWKYMREHPSSSIYCRTSEGAFLIKILPKGSFQEGIRSVRVQTSATDSRRYADAHPGAIPLFCLGVALFVIPTVLLIRKRKSTCSGMAVDNLP